MKRYEFTFAGRSEFVSSAYDEAIKSGADIVVSVGKNQIAVPMTPESFEGMEQFLENFYYIWRSEYK